MLGVRINQLLVLTFYNKKNTHLELLSFFEGHKYGRCKPTGTSVFEFNLCRNSSLQELIKIKVIFVLTQEMFS